MSHINTTTRGHYEKYRKMVSENNIQLNGCFSGMNRDQLIDCWKADKYLNSINITAFDTLYRASWNVLDSNVKRPESLAENVCMYKHAIIYQIIGANPEFID